MTGAIDQLSLMGGSLGILIDLRAGRDPEIDLLETRLSFTLF